MSSVVNFSVLVFPVHLIFSVLFFLIYFLTHFHLFYILVFFCPFSLIFLSSTLIFSVLFFISLSYMMTAWLQLTAWFHSGCGEPVRSGSPPNSSRYTLYSIFSGSGSRSSLELKSGFRKNLNAVPHLGTLEMKKHNNLFIFVGQKSCFVQAIMKMILGRLSYNFCLLI